MCSCIQREKVHSEPVQVYIGDEFGVGAAGEDELSLNASVGLMVHPLTNSNSCLFTFSGWRAC